MSSPANNPLITNAHSFSFASLESGVDALNLADFAGQAVLVVNTASQCGFTPQYKGLEALYQTYGDQGLVVIGVPSNQFGDQEPGDAAQISDFVEERFSVTFPMAAKTEVVGENAHPFYKWAADQKKGGLLFSKPRWNFHKYLVGKDGELLGSWGPQTEPQSEKLISAIESAL